MSELAQSARAAMKAKAKRLTTEEVGKVDCSDWSPSEPLKADVKSGMRPVSRRAYKDGGKIPGLATGGRADRAPRKAGGKIADEIANTNQKDANESREGEKHVGGLARGGVPKGHYDDDKPRLRLIKTHTGPDGHVAKVYKDRDWNEYRTKFFTPDGKYQTKSDSHDSSAEDAHDTAAYMLKRGFASGGAAKSDKSQDKALVKKAFRQHENAEHGGKHVDLKLKRGGMPHKGGGGFMDMDDDMPDREPMRPKRVMREESAEPRYNREAVDKEIGRSRQKIGGREAKMIHALLRGRKDGGEVKKSDGGKIAEMLSPAYALSKGKMPAGGGVLGLLAKKDGGKAEKCSGGRMARKAGGKVNVNIIIAGGKKGEEGQGAPPPFPPPAAMLPPPPKPMVPPGPPPMPVGAPPPMGAPPMAGPPPGGPPMMRKAGGRIRSYKDLDAGALSGKGRLEKTELQKHKG